MGLFGHSRTFKDSGIFILTNESDILADGVMAFNIDDRFKPYEEVSIINNSDEVIGLSFNYSNDFNFLIPAGNQRILNIIVEDIRIKNKGTLTIPANSINLNLRHTGEREKDNIKEKLQIVSQLAMLKNFF